MPIDWIIKLKSLNKVVRNPNLGFSFGEHFQSDCLWSPCNFRIDFADESHHRIGDRSTTWKLELGMKLWFQEILSLVLAWLLLIDVENDILKREVAKITKRIIIKICWNWSFFRHLKPILSRDEEPDFRAFCYLITCNFKKFKQRTWKMV